jgi:hypothetical protein
MEIRSVGGEGVDVFQGGETDGWTEGQTDITKLIVAFRNFANPLRNQM